MYYDMRKVKLYLCPKDYNLVIETHNEGVKFNGLVYRKKHELLTKFLLIQVNVLDWD